MVDIREPDCDRCPLSASCTAKEICIVPESAHVDVLVVMRSPATKRAQRELQALFDEAGVTASFAITGAVRCRTEETPTKANIKACRYFLEKEIAAIKPRWILALGNEALYSVLNLSGISKYRGQDFTREDGIRVFVTNSIGLIYRYPGMKAGMLKDLNLFHNLANGGSRPTPPPVIHVMTKDALKETARRLQSAIAVSFDVETTGFDEFEPGGALISLGLTIEQPDHSLEIHAIPLYHPESPFRLVWKKALAFITPYFNNVPKAIAHNGKFDCRWLRQFGCSRVLTFDTMIAAFLLDENRPKGLKFLATTMLNAPAWEVDARKLLDTPIDVVLDYNGYDTYWTHQLYYIFREELKKHPRLARVFARILMPCSEIFTDIERMGVWLDLDQLGINLKQTEQKLADIDARLMKYVPSDYPRRDINFRPSKFLRWMLFEHLGLRVITRGKQGPSVAEGVMIELRDDHEVIPLLIERARLEKILSGFLRPYAEMVDEHSRLHTTFKLTGTVTGRLSSGRPDQDQVVGRTKARGVNLQQVPRDPFVRNLIGAPPGWAFIKADFSQVEMRISAFLAREEVMLHLYATGQDLHMAMAMKMTNKPKANVTSEERKKAKAVNFGFLYGMGANRFVSTAKLNYGVDVTLEEAQQFRRAFFQQFPGLQVWHARQRTLARKYKRVQSPLGRIRRLPNVDSPDDALRGDAERQAINSPVQSFASDLALIGLIRVTDAFHTQGLRARPVGTVHDEVDIQVPIEELPTAIPLIKQTMQSPPLAKWFGIHLDVPLIADIGVGTRWGSVEDVPEDIAYNPERLKVWLSDHSLSG